MTKYIKNLRAAAFCCRYFDLDNMMLVYLVSVSANDGLHRGFADVIIHVTDLNDNWPTFSQSQFTVSVIENNAPGDIIMTLAAHDDDIGHNAHVTYALISQCRDPFSFIIIVIKAYSLLKIQDLWKPVLETIMGYSVRVRVRVRVGFRVSFRLRTAIILQ